MITSVQGTLHNLTGMAGVPENIRRCGHPA